MYLRHVERRKEVKGNEQLVAKVKELTVAQSFPNLLGNVVGLGTHIRYLFFFLIQMPDKLLACTKQLN